MSERGHDATSRGRTVIGASRFTSASIPPLFYILMGVFCKLGAPVGSWRKVIGGPRGRLPTMPIIDITVVGCLVGVIATVLDTTSHTVGCTYSTPYNRYLSKGVAKRGDSYGPRYE